MRRESAKDADILEQDAAKIRKWFDNRNVKSQQQRPGLSTGKRALWGRILNFGADLELRRS